MADPPDFVLGSRPLTPHLVVAILLALYVGFGLRDLGRSPKVYEDEPVIAAPGYMLVTTGVFGTPLARGFFGSERHCYEFMPLFSILAGASMRLFGPGLFAVRLVALGVAAGVLLLTHFVASRFLSASHGAVAIALLVLAPVMSPVEHLRTGIPMVDLARLARYDVAVSLFGLAALLVLAPILEESAAPDAGRLFAAGILTGAATLSHLYGFFWLPALLLAILAGRGQLVFWRAFVVSGAGFLLALLPWILFVASGWPDFLGQSRHYSERFDLLDPRFYASNLRGELARYGLILAAATRHLAPAFFAAAGVAGGVLLVRRCRSGGGASRALLAIPGLLALLFALLLQSKNVMYLATLWPLFALVASLGLHAAWGRGRLARTILVAAGLLVAGEGIFSLRRFSLEAAVMTPYSDFTSRLSRLVPGGARVMGMQHWWLGLVRTSPDYVSVPFPRTLRRYTPEPVRFEEATDALAPEVLLLDEILRGFLRANVRVDAEFHDLAAAMQDWLAVRGRRMGVVEDPTYGRVEVYALRPAVLSE